jgi:hypothetical protein
MVTCRNGHERTVENTHIRPNGRKRCRDCECASAKIRYRLENPEVRANGLRDRCGHGHVYADGTYCFKTWSNGRRFRLCLICQKQRGRVRNQARYGLTLEQWNALFETQGRKCAGCGSDKHGGKNWQTDHDHSTNRVRGILCHGCNVALGQVKDNILTLLNLVEYLKRNQDGNQYCSCDGYD